MKNQEKEIAKRLTKGISAALYMLKGKIDDITPEDTKELLKNNKVSEIIQIGTKIAGQVYNDTEYAKYVEYGVRGRKYNYHKPKGRKAYTGVGNRTFTRTRLKYYKDAINLVDKYI